MPAFHLVVGPPTQLRAEIRPDEAAGSGRFLLRARLEDRFGNGVSTEGQPPFRAGASRGTLEEFVPAEAPEGGEVGWMEAAFTLIAGETKAVDVRVEAGAWFDTVRVEPAGQAQLYLGLASGYVHNLGAMGLVPLRLGVGWIDAFGATGFQFGAELGYYALRGSFEPRATELYEVQGDALTTYLVLGYRGAVASWLVLLGELALGMEVGWFDVNPPGAAPNVAADALVAFSVGARLVFGFPVGPGLIALQLAYDDARFDDVVRGNVGGLGGLLGYRLEL